MNKKEKNSILGYNREKPIVSDIYYTSNKNAPYVIFCHGFKGFKDWGPWHVVADFFTKSNFHFLTFNFSHNGTTLDALTDFIDLEAFGQNTYSIELEDLNIVIDWLYQHKNPSKVYLIGHSRGGGIALIKAYEDDRVQKVATWASISTFDRFDREKLDEWKEKGVAYILNGRTKQQMPLYYSFYEDYVKNKDRLDIQQAVTSLNKPMLLVHGDADHAVSVDACHKLAGWNSQAEQWIISGGDHVFSGKHPWAEYCLPDHLEKVCEETVRFFR